MIVVSQMTFVQNIFINDNKVDEIFSDLFLLSRTTVFLSDIFELHLDEGTKAILWPSTCDILE